MKMENEKPELSSKQTENANECGSGCDCGASSMGAKGKIIICLIIAAVAVVIVARNLSRKASEETTQNKNTFTTVLPSGEKAQSVQVQDLKTAPSTPDLSKDKVTDGKKTFVTVSKQQDAKKMASDLWGKPLDSLSELNKIATNTDAVFIFMQAKDKKQTPKIEKIITTTADKIKTKGTSTAAYILNETSKDYKDLSNQVSAPCVLVIVKGRGMNAVSGDQVTEQNLMRALVTASRPSSCGPSGCGPATSGCQ
jgi:hypothetical protein